MRKGMLFFSQYRTLRRSFLKNLKNTCDLSDHIAPERFFCRMESFGLRFGPCFAATNADRNTYRNRVASAASGPAARCRRRFRRADMCDRCGGIRPGGLERASCLRVPPQFCRDGCMLFYRGGCMLRTFAGLPGRMHAVLPDRTFAVLRGGCTPFCRGERSLFCRTGRIDRNISYLCPGSRPVFLAPHPLRCTPLSAHRDACPA